MFFVSIALTIAALVLFLIFGLRLGVDFRGGSIMEIEFSGGRPPISDIQSSLKESLPSNEFSLNEAGENGLVLRSDNLSEQNHQSVIATLKNKFADSKVEEKRFDSVGPVIGNELKDKSITAIIMVLIAITIYIAIVFRKMSMVISPWVMGVAAMLALMHDVIIPVGVFALLGHLHDVEIGAVFVAAILTILGFSVSDTVVIFDRIRENFIKNRNKEEFGKLVHQSIMQTLTRSLNTTFTVLLSLIAIYFFGGESLEYFSLALIIGIFLGAYSSIFVASPLLVWWSLFSKRRK
jgi:preprotein translocase subunit SecF